MSKSRRKGHNAERKYADEFRKLGFEECKTSRFESKSLDDAKVDLANIPFNIQIKAGYKRGINYKELLKSIKESLEKSHKDRLELPTLILHEKDVGKGKKRTEFDTLVILTFEDFKKLLNK